MVYRKSKYNVFLNNNIIYNLLKKGFLQVNESLYQFLKSNNDFEEAELGNVLTKLLEYNIITSRDELATIDYLYNSLKFDQSKASFILYPTLLCNFNCDYCFETNKTCQLNVRKTGILTEFFKKQATILNDLNIRWSGGEPLLVWQKIKQITQAILTSAINLRYYFSMATNGYLLNEKNVEELYECRFSQLQITVDGSQEEHNKIRYTLTDKDTYTQVVNGIKIASKLLPVRIRFNVNKDNLNSFDNFLNDLDRKGANNENIQIFVQPTLPKQDMSCGYGLIDDKEFYEQEIKFCSIANKKGFIYALDPNFNSHIRCVFHHINSFVIDPNLYLYKCAIDVGLADRRFGAINHLSEIEISDPNYIENSLAYSPIANAECRNCKVLPVCFGKCPLVWNSKNRMKDAGCIPEKKSIKIKLNKYINYGKQSI